MLYVEINTAKLDKALRIAPDQLKMELGDAFDYLGRKFLKILKQTRLQGPPGIRGRTHGIFKRFKRVMLVPTAGIQSMGTEIFTDSKIARLHEEGGVVEAGGTGSLSVPLSVRTQMYTASGVLRQRYKKPSALKNLKMIPLKGKRFLVKFRSRKDYELTPDKILYVLKNRVKIKPRLGFYMTWQNMENLRIQRLNNAIHKALQKV